MFFDDFLIFFSDVKRACELLEKLQKSKYCGEVPATKLAALQKVLQSEFLNAVREVYEHVYETVDVQGNPEIRASATAKVRLIFRQIKVSKLLYFHDFLFKFYRVSRQ